MYKCKGCKPSRGFDTVQHLNDHVMRKHNRQVVPNKGSNGSTASYKVVRMSEGAREQLQKKRETEAARRRNDRKINSCKPKDSAKTPVIEGFSDISDDEREATGERSGLGTQVETSRENQEVMSYVSGATSSESVASRDYRPSDDKDIPIDWEGDEIGNWPKLEDTWSKEGTTSGGESQASRDFRSSDDKDIPIDWEVGEIGNWPKPDDMWSKDETTRSKYSSEDRGQEWLGTLFIKDETRTYRATAAFVYAQALPFIAPEIVKRMVEQGAVPSFEIMFIVALTVEINRELLLETMSYWKTSQVGIPDIIAWLPRERVDKYGNSSGTYSDLELSQFSTTVKSSKSQKQQKSQRVLLLNVRKIAKLAVESKMHGLELRNEIIMEFRGLQQEVDVDELRSVGEEILNNAARLLAMSAMDNCITTDYCVQINKTRLFSYL